MSWLICGTWHCRYRSIALSCSKNALIWERQCLPKMFKIGGMGVQSAVWAARSVSSVSRVHTFMGERICPDTNWKGKQRKHGLLDMLRGESSS